MVTILERILEPVLEAMPVDFARQLLSLRADRELQARVDELRTKANSGQISPMELDEYDEFIEALDIVAMLQLKAKKCLSNHGL